MQLSQEMVPQSLPIPLLVSWLKVQNVNPTPQYLYLNHMITSTNFKYPSTKVWIHGDQQQQPPALSASDKLSQFTWQVNLEEEIFIGIILPFVASQFGRRIINRNHSSRRLDHYQSTVGGR
jgi:hypothetical protein